MFDAIERQVGDLPLLSDLRLRGDGSGGEISLPEARRMLMDRRTDLALADDLWTQLVALARTGGEEGKLAMLWSILPSLRGLAARFRRPGVKDRRDIESEMLVSVLEAAEHLEPGRLRIGGFLYWRARSRLHQMRFHNRRESPVEDIELAATLNAHPGPDVNPLNEAVSHGIVTVSEADLINRTRVEGERLGSIAERMGLGYHACQQRRARAESRLASYLAGEERVPVRSDTDEPCSWAGGVG
ncbi:sigma factor [Nonomuraea typhae]|uniref:Sigma factor n=1 Tax=Nonomuraea typhae TaxID=2603600 RepID=A0ABW7YSY6_9ACTN